MGQKSKPDNFCNKINFVYCHPIFIIFGIYYRKFATGGCIVSPPNVVCVTTLPCEILTTTFFMLNSVYCCKKSSFHFGSNNCQFLPRDASAERGYEIAFVCLSVCP